MVNHQATSPYGKFACKQYSNRNHYGMSLSRRRAHHRRLLQRQILRRNLPPTSTDFFIQPTEEEKRKATAIIINGIGDRPLRVVAGYMSNPKLMLQKLRERYASSNLSTRMSLMAELQSLRYKSDDMSHYADRYCTIEPPRIHGLKSTT
jgi:hypothetical protein